MSPARPRYQGGMPPDQACGGGALCERRDPGGTGSTHSKYQAPTWIAEHEVERTMTTPSGWIEGSAGRLAARTSTRHLDLDADVDADADPPLALAALGHARRIVAAAASRSRSASMPAVTGGPGPWRSPVEGGRWTTRMHRNGGRD